MISVQPAIVTMCMWARSQWAKVCDRLAAKILPGRGHSWLPQPETDSTRGSKCRPPASTRLVLPTAAVNRLVFHATGTPEGA